MDDAIPSPRARRRAGSSMSPGPAGRRWRLYDDLTPPVVQIGGSLKTVDNLVAKESPPLPADWS